MEYDLYQRLKNALGISTRNDNIFKDVIDSISWEETFFADEEFYFLKGNLIFSTPSLDPFNMPWNPTAVFNGAVFEL